MQATDLGKQFLKAEAARENARQRWLILRSLCLNRSNVSIVAFVLVAVFSNMYAEENALIITVATGAMLLWVIGFHETYRKLKKEVDEE